MRLLSRCIIAAALLSLTACSIGTRFAYNHLETVVDWELADYISLDDAQKAAFDSAFQRLQRWHRQTQLPLYARDLRALAAAVTAAPPAPGTGEYFFATIERHGERLGDHLTAALAPLLPTLSDAQVEQLLAKQRKDIEKQERKHADETPEERLERYRRRIAEGSRHWIGALNARQKQLVDAAWAEGLASLPSAAERRRRRLDDLQRLADLLAQRRTPDFGARLEAFSNAEDTQAERSAQARAEKADDARERQLRIDLLDALDARQRKTLHTRLIDLAEDCEALAAQGAASEAAARP